MGDINSYINTIIIAFVSALSVVIINYLNAKSKLKIEKNKFLLLKLTDFRKKIMETDSNNLIGEVLKSGGVSPEEFASFLDIFFKIDYLYEDYFQPLLDKDLKKKIDKSRQPVIDFVNHNGKEAEFAKAQGNEFLPPDFEPIMIAVIGYPGFLTEIVEKQIGRIKL